MNALHAEWIAKDGSIFTKETEEIKVGVRGGHKIKVHISVAFNIGNEMAEHIVRLHNDSLRLRERQ